MAPRSQFHGRPPQRTKLYYTPFWHCELDPYNFRSDSSSLEYTLGLLDLQNKPRPLGQKLAALVEEFRRMPPEIPARPLALVIPDYGLSQTSPPDWTYGKGYMDLIVDGKKPAIVLESRANDEEYLKARGIKELIPLAKVKG